MTFGQRTSGAAVLGAALLIGLAASPPAEASYIVALTEVGSNVVATGSGTIDLTDLSSFGATSVALINPNSGEIVLGPTSYVFDAGYSGITGPTNFGSGGLAIAPSGSGNVVSVDEDIDAIIVPEGYVSGTSLGTSTATWDNQTFTSLGVTPGTYVWTWGSGANADSFTLDIETTTTVPEPSSLVLLMTALTGFGLLRYRSRRPLAASAVD